MVLGSCKVGNFVVSTPLLPGLKNAGPNPLDFIGSDIGISKQAVHGSTGVAADSSKDNSGFVLLQTLNKRRADLGPVDLAISLDG